MSNESSSTGPQEPNKQADSGKLKPKVNIPEVTESPKREFKLNLPAWLWVTLLVLILGGIGFAVFWIVSETRVVFQVDAADLKVTDRPAVIYNFMGKVDLLRSDYARRMVPVNTEFGEVKSNLAAARADLAGKLESKRLLNTEVDRLKSEIPGIIAGNQTALNDLWVKQGAALDKEFAETKEQYQQKLEARAKELGVEYQRNKDIDSIDVSVNAFKLALYAAPKTVKVEDERKYAEGLLAEWQKYQDEWQKRLASMKDKSQAIRQQPGPQIDGVKARVVKVQHDIEAVDSDIASYQLEVRQYDSRLADLNEQVQQISKQFTDDLLKTPKEFVKMRLTLDGNTAELKGIDERKDEFPAGDYFLLVTAEKDGETYWALKKFTIALHKKSTVYILRSDFVQARTYLSGSEAKSEQK